jgi:hypothetical protein
MWGAERVGLHLSPGDQSYSVANNQRADQYGGSVENRARLMLEVVDASRDSRIQRKARPRGLTCCTTYSYVDFDSLLDKSKIDYYFGNIDDRRVVWSLGRDLMMQPAQDDGPVNSLTKAYVEIDGKDSSDYVRQFSYKELSTSSSSD